MLLLVGLEVAFAVLHGLAEVALVSSLGVPLLHVVLGELVPELLGDLLGVEVARQGTHHDVALIGIQVGVGKEVPTLDELR